MIEGRRGSRRQAVMSISAKIGLAAHILDERPGKAQVGYRQAQGNSD
jgi:hypothetical protein